MMSGNQFVATRGLKSSIEPALSRLSLTDEIARLLTN